MLNQQSPIRQYFSFLSPPRLLVKTLPHIQTSGSPYGLVQVRISYLLYLQIPYWENIHCFSLHFFNTLSPTLYQHTSRTHADLHVAPKMFSGWNLGSISLLSWYSHVWNVFLTFWQSHCAYSWETPTCRRKTERNCHLQKWTETFCRIQ